MQADLAAMLGGEPGWKRDVVRWFDDNAFFVRSLAGTPCREGTPQLCECIFGRRWRVAFNP